MYVCLYVCMYVCIYSTQKTAAIVLQHVNDKCFKIL